MRRKRAKVTPISFEPNKIYFGDNYLSTGWLAVNLGDESKPDWKLLGGIYVYIKDLKRDLILTANMNRIVRGRKENEPRLGS